MGKFEKAISRLKSKPKDFTWKELVSIMTHFGYTEIKGGGSRRKFYHTQTKSVVSLHEPHPCPVLKTYAIEVIIDHLKEQKLI